METFFRISLHVAILFLVQKKFTEKELSERSTTTLGRNIDRTEWNTEPTEPIFGRTDLRKGVSEAKFDVEADFDVKNPPAFRP